MIMIILIIIIIRIIMIRIMIIMIIKIIMMIIIIVIMIMIMIIKIIIIVINLTRFPNNIKKISITNADLYLVLHIKPQELSKVTDIPPGHCSKLLRVASAQSGGPALALP